MNSVNNFRGEGTEEDPFVIKSAEDLENLHHISSKKNYSYIEIAGDIDASEIQLGFLLKFNGVLNGKNHTITNLTLSSNCLVATNKGIIKNIKFKNISIENKEAGINSGTGLVKLNSNAGEIRNISLENGEIISRKNDNVSNVGSIAGKNKGEIVDCYSSSFVRGAENLGGLVGQNHGIIEHSYFVGKLTNGNIEKKGGLVGNNTGVVKNCCWLSNEEGIGSQEGKSKNNLSKDTVEEIEKQVLVNCI